MNDNEKIYKSCLKMIEIYVLRVFMHILHLIFPMKKNRIFFSAHRGMQYSCSPRYITEMLLKKYPNEYEIIWAFERPNEHRELEKRGVIIIPYYSLKRFYYEATSKISINNIGGYSWNPLRRGQKHVNTWHSGIEITYCGINEKNNDRIMKKTIKMNAQNTSLMFASNTWYRDFAAREQFAYDGEFWEYGLPRSDDLVNGNSIGIRKQVREKLRIDEDTIVLMYAPTWRYGRASAMPEFDYELIKNALIQKFGDNILLIKRSHHMARDNEIEDSEYIMNLTTYPNIEELIIISDIVVSDYSSVIWDATLSGKYIMLYAPDEARFNEERGIYMPIDQWIYPVAYSMDELASLIAKIDFQNGKQNTEQFLERFGNLESGHSAELFVEWINKVVK